MPISVITEFQVEVELTYKFKQYTELHTGLIKLLYYTSVNVELTRRQTYDIRRKYYVD